MSWYRTGTISVNNGASTVTGVGTLFVSNIKEGYALLGPDLSVYEVANISSDTSFSIVGTYRGSNVTGGVYAIFQTQGYVRDLLNQVTDLLNTFGAFRDAYNNGDLVGTGLELKGVLNSPSDLPPSPAEGDAYLIGTSIYVYTVAGGWRNSNIAGVIPRGAWSAGTAYAYNDLVTYLGSQYRRIVAGTTAGNPASDTTNWAIFVQKGDTGATGPSGVNPTGVWSAITAYALNDLATYGGSTWRRIVAGTTATTPDMDVVNWAVFAAKGIDGTGAVSTVNGIGPDLGGNVTVPSDTQVFANIAAFPGTGVNNRIYVAQDSNLTYRYDTSSSSYKQIGGSAGYFPIYTAAGVGKRISLTNDNKLPFFKASGTASNIPLVTT